MAENPEREEYTENSQNFRVVQRTNRKHSRERNRDDLLNRNREEYADIENRFKYISSKEMEELAMNLKKTKDVHILQKIQNAARFGDKHIEAFFKVNGAFSVLISLLCGRNGEKQLEAATCLTNLSCGCHKLTLKIAKAAGAYLISYMKGGSHYLQDQCAWTVGNIASDCLECFSVLNSQGVLPVLEHLINSVYEEVVQSAAFALSACTQYATPELRNLVQKSLVSSLIATLNRKGLCHQSSAHILFSLSNVSTLAAQSLSEHQLTEVVNSILLALHAAVQEQNVMLITPSIRCIGGLSAASDNLCQFTLHHSAFGESVVPVMTSKYSHLKKEMLCVLNNLLISCGTSGSSVDWHWIVQALRPYLSPLDSFVLQVLYFYCILVTLNPEFSEVLSNSQVEQQVQMLSSCGKREVEVAAKTFLSMLPQHTKTTIQSLHT